METENRKITNFASFVITVFMTVSFGIVWLFRYNDIIFHANRDVGGLFCIVIWLIFYLKFTKIYSAFKIASNSIGEVAFSQFLSISFSDLLLYIGGCLAARKYINVWPGLLTVMIQLFIGLAWAWFSKRFFLDHVNPQKCLLLFEKGMSKGDRLYEERFVKKLEYSYGHLFDIENKYEITDINKCLKEINKYPVIFIYNVSPEQRDKIVGYCVETAKRFYITPTLEDAIACGYQVKHFIDTPILAYNSSSRAIKTYFGKRCLDIVFSMLLLIVFSPIMLVTAFSIKVEDHGDIFFKQKRVGAGGKVFNILKFRSMIMNAETDGKPMPAITGDPRITNVGKFIRKTRIDELPQLLNILKGDISLVGPRPERVEHVELYTKELPEFSYRLRVPAGLTGYAQIYGKYNTSPKDKLLLDLLYIEQQCFLMDLKIVFLTIKIVFSPESTEGFEKTDSQAITEYKN